MLYKVVASLSKVETLANVLASLSKVETLANVEFSTLS
jgi:hypothetical protein